MSSNFSCLVAEPVGVPDRPSIGTIVPQISVSPHGTRETTEYTDPVNNVTTFVKSNRLNSMSPDFICLVSKPKNVPARSVSGTVVPQISTPLPAVPEQIEPNKTESAHIQASELSQTGFALELRTECKKMPIQGESSRTILRLLLCRLIACNIMGPQDNSEKTHRMFSQSLVQPSCW